MRASASSRTSPSANLYASQAKANTNKADQASPFALLLEATAPSQGAKPSKKDAQDSGDKPDNKAVPTQNDTTNGTAGTDQAALQSAARPASAAKTEKADKRQDNTAKPSDDAADNSQAPGMDSQLADQQAAAATQVPQQQPAVAPSAHDDGDDLEALAAADAANAPTRAAPIKNAQTPLQAQPGSAQNVPAQNIPAQNNGAAATPDTQPVPSQDDASAADANTAAAKSDTAAMTRADAAMHSDDRQTDIASAAQAYSAVPATPKADPRTAAPKTDTKPAIPTSDSAAAPADPRPETADAQTIAAISAAPSTDARPAASQPTTSQPATSKVDATAMSVAALAQPAASPDDQAANTAAQALPQPPIKNDTKPAAPREDAAALSFAKTPGKMTAADPITTDANTSDAGTPAQPPVEAAASDTAKAAPQPVQAANTGGLGAPQAPQPSFTPPVITQHVQVTAQAAPNLPALAVEIAAKSQSGAKQFDIRLDPPELGRVDVRLSIDATGKASAHLSADQPQTLTLLQNDAPALTRALREAGLDVSQDGLNFSLRQQAENFNGNTGEDGRRGSPRNFSLTATADIDAAAVTAAYRGAANGRLDIRV